MSILLVEDDKKASDLLIKGLKEENFFVDPAYSTEEAETCLYAKPYHLIILDWLLPNKPGIVWCEELRKRGIKIPILMLTARDALQDRVQGLNVGADDYLTKPFAFEELLARIRALLRRTELNQSAPILQIADLIVETQTRKVTRGKLTINLTPKEYALLETLLHHTGSVVSRNQLAELLWHNDHIGVDNLIDVHIRNLRRKIDYPGTQKLIYTVRGKGFMITTHTEDDVEI